MTNKTVRMATLKIKKKTKNPVLCAYFIAYICLCEKNLENHAILPWLRINIRSEMCFPVRM